MNKQPIRILIVDDSPAFLEAAVAFLSGVPQFEIVGRALSAEEALEQVRQLQPDLVLLDVVMPKMDGFEVTRRIKGMSGAPRVVILTVHDLPAYRTAAMAAGADGFVAKSDLGEQVLPLVVTLFGKERL